MIKKSIIIISNESVSYEKNHFYCDNVDIKSISEELDSKFSILHITRFSKIKRFYKININKIKASSNVVIFLLNILKTTAKKNTKYLIVSITPYTFFAFLLLFPLRKNIFVYLRSDGFKEYEMILGKKWIWIYKIMFNITTFSSIIISCHENLSKGKKQILIKPSELDREWFLDLKEANLELPNLLYVGRLKIEKGIYSLISVFKNINSEIKLTLTGDGDDLKKEQSNNIKLQKFISSKQELINCYDNHNIVILPSFTEAHPKVIDEALARLRPVIVFHDIKHVIGDRKGVFSIERNPNSLKEMIFYIMNHYKNIQKEMEKNVLPTKENFINDLVNVLEK